MSYSSPHINTMLTAARQAGKKLVRDFGEVENLQVSIKGVSDFVSAADIQSEKILINELSRAYPDYDILAEEAGEIKNCTFANRSCLCSHFIHHHPPLLHLTSVLSRHPHLHAKAPSFAREPSLAISPIALAGGQM